MTNVSLTGLFHIRSKQGRSSKRLARHCNLIMLPSRPPQPANPWDSRELIKVDQTPRALPTLEIALVPFVLHTPRVQVRKPLCLFLPWRGPVTTCEKPHLAVPRGLASPISRGLVRWWWLGMNGCRVYLSGHFPLSCRLLASLSCLLSCRCHCSYHPTIASIVSSRLTTPARPETWIDRWV